MEELCNFMIQLFLLILLAYATSFYLQHDQIYKKLKYINLTKVLLPIFLIKV